LRFFPREASEEEEARVAVGGMGGGGGFCAGCLRRGGSVRSRFFRRLVPPLAILCCSRWFATHSQRRINPVTAIRLSTDSNTLCSPNQNTKGQAQT
jgi:hypothetical protein